jgi:hypothetical protein
MSFRLLVRLAVVATAVALFASASLFSPSARADDPAQAAHESAVLDRIFANWKARHDRVHSIHFTWDSRMTSRKGSWDPASSPPSRLDRDQEFKQFGAQLWIDGDERICVVNTPCFKVPPAKLTDTGRVVSRWVSDCKTQSIFYVNSAYETGTPRLRAASRGHFFRSPPADEQVPNGAFQALLLNFRPQFPSVTWRREQCRLVGENAIVDGCHYVKIQRVIEGSRNTLTRDVACWVDPARDDVVVHWTVKTGSRGTAPSNGSIKYQKDKIYGWIPSEWNYEYSGRGFDECKVTNYAINEKIAPATFAQVFPSGTPVEDRLSKTHYVVQQDGSKTMISREEFERLWESADPPKKQVPSKSQTK